MKKALWVIAALVLVGGAIAVYQYNKPHRNYTEEEASIGVEAPKLNDEYVTDMEAANAKYLDQVIEIKGVVTNKEDKSLLIEPNIYVNLADTANLTNMSEGDVIKIKGRVLGYDELMEEVKIDQAIIYKYQ